MCYRGLDERHLAEECRKAANLKDSRLYSKRDSEVRLVTQQTAFRLHPRQRYRGLDPNKQFQISKPSDFESWTAAARAVGYIELNLK